MPTFVLIPLPPTDQRDWFEKIGDVYYNRCGGRFTSTHEDILETVEVEGFDDLDWNKTGMLKPESETGWLSPDGKWYGCDYCDHDAVAHYIIGKSVYAMGRSGWIRVAGKHAILYCYNDPTQAQRDWAFDNLHLFDQSDPIFRDPAA